MNINDYGQNFKLNDIAAAVEDLTELSPCSPGNPDNSEIHARMNELDGSVKIVDSSDDTDVEDDLYISQHYPNGNYWSFDFGEKNPDTSLLASEQGMINYLTYLKLNHMLDRILEEVYLAGYVYGHSKNCCHPTFESSNVYEIQNLVKDLSTEESSKTLEYYWEKRELSTKEALIRKDFGQLLWRVFFYNVNSRSDCHK